MEFFVTIPHSDVHVGRVYHPLDTEVMQWLEEGLLNFVEIYKISSFEIVEGEPNCGDIFGESQGYYKRDDYIHWRAEREKVAAWRDDGEAVAQKIAENLDKADTYFKVEAAVESPELPISADEAAQALADQTGRSVYNGSMKYPSDSHVSIPEVLKCVDKWLADGTISVQVCAKLKADVVHMKPGYPQTVWLGDKITQKLDDAVHEELTRSSPDVEDALAYCKPVFQFIESLEKPGFGQEGNKIDPPHYQGFFVAEEFGINAQWIETRSGIMEPDRFEGFLENTVDKYQSRRGKKDEEIQELKKALWYQKYWIAYLVNGRKFTKVSDVEELINK